MLRVQEELKNKSILITTLVVVMIYFWAPLKVFAQSTAIGGQISRIGDTTHLEFHGRKDWLYDAPKKEGSKITITVPAFDEPTLMQLQSWNCAFIKDVKVNKSAPDGKYELTFNLTSPNVESFDYLTDDPSHLIFDFYRQAPKEKPAPVAVAEPSPTAKSKKPSGRKAKTIATRLPEKGESPVDGASNEYKKRDRRPASDEILNAQAPGTTTAVTPKPDVTTEDPQADIQFERGVFDGGDPNFDRFKIKDYQIRENSIIASQQNIYIRFPGLMQKLNRFTEMMKTPPLYEIKPEETVENKEARFLMTLFNKERPGAFFETYKYFTNKYPHSRYDQIVKNLAAEEHVKLYKRDHDQKDFEEARSLYSYLVETYPDSPLAERNLLLLAYASLEHNDGAETLRHLQRYAAKYPTSSERDYVRLGEAEAYLLLNKPEDAVKTYENLMKDPSDKNFAVEAAYRIGDVYFEKKEYQKALDTYKAVQEKYPQHKLNFPNAEYNIGEAQFWLGQYKNSLNSYIDFLKNFPNHKHGGFALTRVGELLGIMGADQSRVMGAFIESYFRYPESQGAEVARLRMLSQGLKSMKEREKKRAIDEIDEIAAKSTLPQIQEFVTLTKADGYSRRAEHMESLNLLLAYYHDHPTNVKFDVFNARILRNIADVMKEDLDKKNYIDALNFYGKYSTTWLKNANRMDTSYYQASAYEHAGVLKEAEKSYRRILDSLKAMAGKKEEKERSVYEHLPSISQVNLRLASVALEQKRYRDAFSHLGNIKDNLTAEEEIERVQIGASVAEQMGDLKQAVTYLEKLVASYEKQPELVVGPKLNLARLYLKTNQIPQCEKQMAQVEKLRDVGTVFSDDDLAKALEFRGDLQVQVGQKLAAVETYTKLLENFETKRPMSSIRYRTGKILFDEGDLKGAEKVWSTLDSETGGFYKKLAQEKISQAEWQDTYKKYIDRIPAAKDLK